PYAGRTDYAYRNNPRAFTAVPRNVFAGAKPVRAAVLHVNPASLAKATGAPIPVAQLQQMRQQHAQAQPESQRVHVVAAAPKRGAPLPPMKQAPGQPPATAHGAQPPMVRAPRPGEPIPPHQA